jgi:glycogen phosphorylase
VISPRRLPDALAPLLDLALDLRWTWSHVGDSLWRQIDAALWERSANPFLTLQHTPQARLEALSSDAAFIRELEELSRERREFLDDRGWFGATHGEVTLGRVAYFSMEFGLSEALPLYAGGLGILAGDHLKTASDLGVPLVGIGLLWQQGYFRQFISPGGYQLAVYPHNEPSSLPLQPLLTPEGEWLHVALELPGRTILLRTWLAMVGRVRLYLLDSNHLLNTPVDRGLTSSLYGGDLEIRLMQEMILGVGGWRLLEQLGEPADVCHLNEGHAAFAIIERARSSMRQHGTDFWEALWATRIGNVFTTHTAVPAGFDTFPAETIEKYASYFDRYVSDLGISWPELLALGRSNPRDQQEPFSMAYLALRGSAFVNGVSRLHGAVSRRLFAGLFPRRPVAEVPVSHITNGIHVPSWDSPWADELWTRAAGKERWRGDVDALSHAIRALSDENLWTLCALERHDLVLYVRERLSRQLGERGADKAEVQRARQVLDSQALTLGWARRFAGYKRPDLLLADPARLRRLLTNPERPAQLVIAGKAHPNDEEGKRLVQAWVGFAEEPELRQHVVFLEDYDMVLAKELVQGVDLWINTPRRPWEASGTSGMKVLVNGGLNLSVLDGWWAEAYAADLGWALGDGGEHPAGEWDARDAAELYRLLEDEVVPSFYERDELGIPRGWLRRMRASMSALAPRFSSNRMVREYVEQAYLPAAAGFRARNADHARLARELHAWWRALLEGWQEIRFGPVSATRRDAAQEVAVQIHLGEIQPEWVRVELFADGVANAPAVVAILTRAEPVPGDRRGFVYRGHVATDRPLPDFTARVVPFHPEARVPIEAPLIAWAR